MSERPLRRHSGIDVIQPLSLEGHASVALPPDAAIATCPPLAEALVTPGLGETGRLDDVRLAEGIAAHDMSAFAEAFRRHAPRLLGLARRICGPEGDDVVQDTFTRLWQRPAMFDASRGSLGAFLYTMAHGRAVDVLRSSEARRAREGRVASTPVRVELAREASAEVHVLTRDRAQVVRGLLGRLSPPQREAIALAYLGGRTYREVADQLGLPHGTVKARIRSGLARLAEMVETEGIEPLGSA